jgi:hypothetical protein
MPKFEFSRPSDRSQDLRDPWDAFGPSDKVQLHLVAPFRDGFCGLQVRGMVATFFYNAMFRVKGSGWKNYMVAENGSNGHRQIPNAATRDCVSFQF